MYWTGKNPLTGRSCFIERSFQGREKQKQVLTGPGRKKTLAVETIVQEADSGKKGRFRSRAKSVKRQGGASGRKKVRPKKK